MDIVQLVTELNRLAGVHGVGRIDHVENRVVGIKSREVYECPAAVVLLTAHRDLEQLCLPREVTAFKRLVEQRFAEVVYQGLWYSPLRGALQVFCEYTQHHVTGVVRVRLHKGCCRVVGRKSPYSVYDHSVATYDRADSYDHTAAQGFVKLWGLPTEVYAACQRKVATMSLPRRA